MKAGISFGKSVKQRRKALDLTQTELALRVGCSPVTIQKVETDQRRPSKQIAHLLAKHLDIPRDECPYFEKFARGAPSASARTARSPDSTTAPWRTSRRNYTNLPVSTTTLIGRDQDVAAVKDRLLQDKVHLLTLVGAPGIGKTRLGIQVAEEMLDDFEDGAFFIGLAPIRDPDLVPMAIAQTLGIKGPPGMSLGESLKNYLADRCALLLLDNFEQVVSAAPVVAELLTTCAWLKVLVTSRVPLHVRAERQFEVSPLALPPLQRLPEIEALHHYPAVALFVDRAQTVKPDFVLAEENAVAVAEICARLDGLPLAIELVAARSDVSPPQELLAQLDTGQPSSQMLSSGLRDLPDRQQTLHDAIRWSYDLLTPREQTLFARLGVFVGGCTLDAGKTVCEGAERDGLESLVNKSLVQRRDVNSEPRFVMLETIRQYAHERLSESGELTRVRDRHLHFYAQFAEDAEPKLRGAEQMVWLNRMEAERDNLRAALTWSLECGAREAGLRIGASTFLSWLMRGQDIEGERWLKVLVEKYGAGEPTPALGKAFVALGINTFALGNLDASFAAIEASLPILRKEEDEWWYVNTRLHKGWILRYRGDLTGARAIFEEMVALARELEDEWTLGNALSSLGVVCTRTDLQSARRVLEESVRIFRKIGDGYQLARSLIYLGSVAHRQQD